MVVGDLFSEKDWDYIQNEVEIEEWYDVTESVCYTAVVLQQRLQQMQPWNRLMHHTSELRS